MNYIIFYKIDHIPNYSKKIMQSPKHKKAEKFSNMYISEKNRCMSPTVKHKEKFHQSISVYRYEFLLFALLILIFDKIFFPSSEVYIKYIWPLNMVIISIASFGIFHERSLTINP